MYAAHFGLERLPFEPLSGCPNPFWSRSLCEAQEHFLYARRYGQTFLLLVGEPGVGKSVAIATMVAALHPRTPIAVVRHPTLTPRELLEEIARRFGLHPTSTESKSCLLARLEGLFRRGLEEGRCPLLVLDEAQLLSPSALEEVRLLTNLELDGARMLQVCIAGQPEIVEHLKTERLKQLRQRVSLQVRVEPLMPGETSAYLAHRLQEAGSSRPEGVFSRAAIAGIHHLTRGVPREIDVVAHQALVHAYLEDRTEVLPEDVAAVPPEIGFESVASPVETSALPSEPSPSSPFAPSAHSDNRGPLEADAASSEDVEIERAGPEIELPTERSGESRRFAAALAAVLLVAAGAGVLALALYEAPARELHVPLPPPPPAAEPRAPGSRLDIGSGHDPVPMPAARLEPAEETPPSPPDADAMAPPELDESATAPPTLAANDESPTVAPGPMRLPPAAGPPDASMAAELEAETLNERAAELAERGKMDEAIVFFRRVVELRPDGFQGRFNLGTALLATGAYEEAATELRRAVAIAPESDVAARNLGRALLGSGSPLEAVETLRRAVRLSPEEPSAYEVLGMAFARLGRGDEAIESLRRAASLAPRDSGVLQSLGFVLRENGRYAEAVESFRRALAVDPDSARVHEYLGRALLDLGRPSDAAAALRRAAELSPHDARAQHQLGYALERSGRLYEAIEAFRRATELDPSFGPAYYSEALALREAGFDAEADRALDAARRLGFEPPP